VGCRGRGPKDELIRVVRTPDGIVELDPTRRAPGRGAYVHPARDCLRRAIRTGAFGRSLRVSLDPVAAARLFTELSDHPGVRS
jgi:predicted RNA-binding protein YlxR (DUF448 family)